MVCNMHGDFIGALSADIGNNSNNAADIWVIRDGLQVAKLLGILELHIETDSMLNIQLIPQAFVLEASEHSAAAAASSRRPPDVKLLEEMNHVWMCLL